MRLPEASRAELSSNSIMEVLFQLLFILVLASLVLTIFTFCRLGSTKSSSRLPPGPRKLPLIGNLHNLAGSLPHRRLEALSLKFGPLMHLQLGELSVVVVSSPEFAEQVLKVHDASLASRPKVMSPEILGYGCTFVSFSPYGEYWRQMKKFLSQELLSPKRVQSFRSIREQVFVDVVKTFASNEGFPVNFSEMVYSAVYEVLLMVVLGDVTKDTLNLIDLIKEASVLASGFDIADMYPSMELLQRFSTSRRKLFRYHEDADKAFDKMIQDHRIAIHNEGKKQDLLDTLLKYQDEGSGFPLTTDNIKAVIMDVLLAGSDTSSVTSDWAMAEMMKNPTILKKAQQEVREAFDDKGYVDESDLDQLKYLKAVIKETMRLHPPVPLLLPRKCMQRCEINGYEIPVDSTIMVNAWAINRDPSYWNNPDSFQPERFLESAIDYRGNNFEYIPFGGGRRICPGITFGLANVQLPLAMFLYYFDWKLPSGMKPEEVDMTERHGLTIPKKKPLLIVPVVKRALSAYQVEIQPQRKP